VLTTFFHVQGKPLILFSSEFKSNFLDILFLTVLVGGFEPLTWWVKVKCSTTVLAPQVIIWNNIFHIIFSLSPDASSWIWTLDLKTWSRVFYHCASTMVNILPHNFLFLVASSGIWTLDLMTLSKKFYHCASARGDNWNNIFFSSFLSLDANSGIWTLDLMTWSRVFSHCASTTGVYSSS